MKSGNLNFLEPSVPLQACSGTDFTGTADVRVEKKGESTNYRLSTFKYKTTLQTAAHRFEEKCVV
jgi:hypothetical protein